MNGYIALQKVDEDIMIGFSKDGESGALYKVDTVEEKEGKLTIQATMVDLKPTYGNMEVKKIKRGESK